MSGAQVLGAARHPAARASRPQSHRSLSLPGCCSWAVAAVGAAVAEAVTFPLDTTKIRLQLQGEAVASGGAAAQKRGMVGMMVHVVKSEGIAGLYGGLSAALLRQVVYGGLGVGLYEPVRKLLIGDMDPKLAPLW